MQIFIYPLIIAAISGLTIVAYKNPKFYIEKFYNKLFLISLLGICVDGLWTIAIKKSFSVLKDFISEKDLVLAETNLSKIYLPENTHYCFLALMLFTFFLNWLSIQRKYED